MPPPVTHPVAWPCPGFAPRTGTLELAVAEAVQAHGTRPVRVTAILSVLLETLDGARVDTDLIRSLSTGTREWLVQQAGARCRQGTDWFDLTCRACGEAFDVAADLADLPRAEVPAGFPHVEVDTDVGRLVFRLPNGADEEALASGGPPQQRLGLLLTRLAADDQTRRSLSRLPAQSLQRIDAALDAAAPEVADTLRARCPACGTDTAARIDPVDYAFPDDTALLADVDRLSRAYHWSEADILALPSRRRQRYVGLVATPGRGAP